jgi:hypothetical protein
MKTTLENSQCLVRGNRLKPSARAEALSAFIYRVTHENMARNPRLVRQTGSRLPPISDQQWLEITEFRVTRSGDLDMRTRFCFTNHHEIPAHKAILDEWAANKPSLAVAALTVS